MRRLFSFLVVTSLIFACSSKKSSGVTVTSEDGKEKVTIDVNTAQNAAEAMKKMTEDLQKLPPLSLDQLKAMVPEELMGVKRKNYNVSSAMGTGLATAEYPVNDSSHVKLNIYDCAGPAGAGLFSLQYMGMMNMESESDDEYTKSIDFNGGKAYEHCQKHSNECTLTYIAGNRLLVTLEGRNVGVDALKQTASSLNLK